MAKSMSLLLYPNFRASSKLLRTLKPVKNLVMSFQSVHIYPSSHLSTPKGAMLHTSPKYQQRKVQLPKQNEVIHSDYNALLDTVNKKDTSLSSKHKQFTMALEEFKKREKYLKGHVGFIRVAMQRMDEFGLEKNLETYNKIMDVFPKGRFVPKRMIDALWPRSTPQLELALELLTKMEENGIRPSFDTYDIVKAVFGYSSFPMEKCIRLMYLFEKYKDIDPYEIRAEIPTDPVELSRMVLIRILGYDGRITEYKLPVDSSAGENYIMSASTDCQIEILSALRDFKGSSLLLHIEGPHRQWLHKVEQFYYSLRLSGGAELGMNSEDAEQLNEEGLILGVCTCSPHNQDSLQEWMTHLQETYPSLANATIIYNIRDPVGNDCVIEEEHSRTVGSLPS